MKLLATILLVFISTPCFSQWRMVKVSSVTDTQAITENFRRASLWSNRKLDRFSSDSVYGQPVFVNGIKFADSTIQTTAVVSTGSFATSAQLTSTASALTALTAVVNTKVSKSGDTMTGQLTVQSSITVSGIEQNTGLITNVSSHTQICLNSECIDSFANIKNTREFFLTPYASDVATYNLMLSTPLVSMAASTRTLSLASSDIIVSSYITQVGYPDLTVIPEGQWTIHAWASKDSGTKDIGFYTKAYKRDTGGTETLLATSPITYLTSSLPVQIMGQTNVSAISLSSTDRIVVKIFSNVSGVGSTPTVSFYLGGVYYSDLDLPALAPSIDRFVPYTGATKITTLGAYGLATSSSVTAYNVTVSSTVCFPDGSCMSTKASGTGGGGDVYLANNNVMTGKNYFTGNTTFSSSTTFQTKLTDQEVSTNTVMTVNSTQTVTGSKTFNQPIDIGLVLVSSSTAGTVTNPTVNCPAGTKTLGVILAYCNSANDTTGNNHYIGLGGTDSLFRIYCMSNAGLNYIQGMCARIK